MNNDVLEDGTVVPLSIPSKLYPLVYRAVIRNREHHAQLKNDPSLIYGWARRLANDVKDARD